MGHIASFMFVMGTAAKNYSEQNVLIPSNNLKSMTSTMTCMVNMTNIP